MLFPDLDENTLFISRTDINEILGSFSIYPFELDNQRWLSVEHYFQAMKFEKVAPEHYKKIIDAKTAKQARRIGRSRFSKPRPDWKQVRRIVMTRAIYTKAKTHSEVKEALLKTDNRKILENNQYDYFWGCGRDRRGENLYGKILMDVRDKLREEDKTEDTANAGND